MILDIVENALEYLCLQEIVIVVYHWSEYVEILRDRDGRDELTGPAGKDDNNGEKGDKGEPGTPGEQGLQGPPGPISGGPLYIYISVQARWGRELPVQVLQEHNYCILV